MNTIVSIRHESSNSSYIPKENELVFVEVFVICGNGQDSVKEILNRTILNGGSANEI